MMVNIHKSWWAPALSATATLILLVGCNAPPPPPEPPPQAEEPVEAPPPPLLGGPPASEDDHRLMGGPAYATPDTPGPLTTFRRADGVQVTVMRPIPNPQNARPRRAAEPAHHHARHHQASRVHGPHRQPPRPQAAPPAHPGAATALPPTRPVPPARTVENPRPARVAATGLTSALVQPPAGPAGLPTPTPAPPPAPSWGDRFSGDRIDIPGLGPVSSRSFAGGMLVLLAMVIVVAIARRMANAREARERAQAREARAVLIPQEAPSEPPPEASAENHPG